MKPHIKCFPILYVSSEAMSFRPKGGILDFSVAALLRNDTGVSLRSFGITERQIYQEQVNGQAKRGVIRHDYRNHKDISLRSM